MKIIFDKKIQKFTKKLDEESKAKILTTFELLEKLGKYLKPPHSKKIRSNLFELRIKGKNKIRFFYFFQNNKIIVVLHAIFKKSQKIPKKDIDLALKRANKHLT